MIVKNESEVIGRCLESVKDVIDEMIIVDTGSMDNTKDIVRGYTDKVYDFQWIDDFAAARNFAFSLATMDYILWLDADDLLIDGDRAKFRTLKQTLNSSVDSVTMHYNLAFDDSGNVTSSLRRNRLVKTQNHFKWHGAVHEYLEVWGNIFHSDIAVTHKSIEHDSDRNLRIYEARLAKGEQFLARDLYYFANELADHGMHERAIEFYEKFLATNQGWVEDNISACGRLADCCLELGNRQRANQYALKSFEYDTPRAEFCCRVGYMYLEQGDPRRAVVWYKFATQLEKPENLMGTFNHACWTWLPHLQLCVCYWQLGQYQLAYSHNEKARRYIPDNPSVMHNKQLLEPLWGKSVKEVDTNFRPVAGAGKLRITYIMQHTKVCGAVKILLEQANRLVDRGHEVCIVCRNPMPSWTTVKANFVEVPAGQSMTNLIPDSDVIVTTVCNQILDCYLSQKAPVIHYEHGDTYIFEFDKYSRADQNYWHQCWAIPVPILAVSSALAEQLEKVFGRRPAVLHNVFNDNMFFPRRENKSVFERARILFVGPEQWPYKGIRDVHAAIDRVCRSGRLIEPVWVTQIEPSSPFDGSLYVNPSPEQLGEIYRSCDVYVCGSHYESFGLPALEAMASGCAVVSTRNPGVLEYAKHGYNCLLAEIGDVNGMADTIVKLLDDTELRAHLVRGGYETAKKFTWDSMLDRLEMFIYGQKLS